MKTFDPVIGSSQLSVQQNESLQVSKLNKINNTSIFKDLKISLCDFRKMYKEMDAFSKTYIGSRIINCLIVCMSEFIHGYSEIEKSEKLKHLNNSLEAIKEIRNLLKIGYEINAFVLDSYVNFMDRQVKTQNAIKLFIASQTQTE